MGFSDWLDRYPPSGPKDEDVGSEEAERRAIGKRTLAKKAPDAELDLHGMTAEAAEAAINEFLRSSYEQGHAKVIIIHGKGEHSDGEPVLRTLAYRVVETSEYAGMTGIPDKKSGGSGALWVAIRKKDRRGASDDSAEA